MKGTRFYERQNREFRARNPYIDQGSYEDDTAYERRLAKRDEGDETVYCPYCGSDAVNANNKCLDCNEYI